MGGLPPFLWIKYNNSSSNKKIERFCPLIAKSVDSRR